MKITCWPSPNRPAEGRLASLDALLSRMRAPRTYAKKGDAPRWAGAVFRDGYRNLEHFVEATVIVLDIDASATRAEISEAFGDVYGFAHTTWTAGRWRVGLILDRSVTLADEEHGRVLRACLAYAETRGLAPEYGQSAAHCYAVPALGGAPYEYLELTGAFFEVEPALAKFPKPEPPPTVERTHGVASYEQRFERARRYLEKMPGAISGSGGHRTTFAAAVKMVRGFGLEPDDALRLLVEVHNPLCAPAWSARELRHKVRQAYQRSRLPFGFLADVARDGRAA